MKAGRSRPSSRATSSSPTTGGSMGSRPHPTTSCPRSTRSSTPSTRRADRLPDRGLGRRTEEGAHRIGLRGNLAADRRREPSERADVHAEPLGAALALPRPRGPPVHQNNRVQPPAAPVDRLPSLGRHGEPAVPPSQQVLVEIGEQPYDPLERLLRSG